MSPILTMKQPWIGGAPSNSSSRLLKKTALGQVGETWFTLHRSWRAAMRGADEASGSSFGHVDLESRIPARHPLRTIRLVGDRRARQPRCQVRGALHPFRAPLDPAGTADPGEPDPDPVLGPLRATADGADTGQPAVASAHHPDRAAGTDDEELTAAFDRMKAATAHLKPTCPAADLLLDIGNRPPDDATGRRCTAGEHLVKPDQVALSGRNWRRG